MSTTEPQLPSFEKALDNLEKIIVEMEGGDIPLDKLIGRFEEGTKLIQICQKHLKDAELRIEQFRRNIADADVGAPEEQRTS